MVLEGHLVSAPPFVSPWQMIKVDTRPSESGGRLFVAYAAPESPAAALRERVVELCLPTDIHSLMQKHTPRKRDLREREREREVY
jgi:hypothetical protein